MNYSATNYFLGGRYFSKYFYLTCGILHFCCDRELVGKNDTEIIISGWTIKNIETANIG